VRSEPTKPCSSGSGRRRECRQLLKLHPTLAGRVAAASPAPGSGRRRALASRHHCCTARTRGASSLRFSFSNAAAVSSRTSSPGSGFLEAASTCPHSSPDAGDEIRAVDLPQNCEAFPLARQKSPAQGSGFSATGRRRAKRLVELTSGLQGDPHYPVQWAREPSTSFLLTQQATREKLETAGFRVLVW